MNKLKSQVMNLNFLLPRQPIFFKYFNEHGRCLAEISDLLYKLSDEFDDFKEYSKKAREIEHQADRVSRRITDTLNKTIITPFDREDIHLITRKTDRVVDLIDGTIKKIYIYQISEKLPAVSDFSELIFDSTGYLVKLIGCLEDQKHTTKVKDIVVKIHKLEDNGDFVFKKAIADLFKNEKDPMRVIKWKDIFEDLEMILDRCKNVSNVIEGVLIKSS